MNKEIFHEQKNKIADLKNVCEGVENVFQDLSEVSAVLSVISKATTSPSENDATKLCVDVSCTLDILISKITECQNNIEITLCEIQKIAML